MLPNLGKPKRYVVKIVSKILCGIKLCDIIISSGSYYLQQGGPKKKLKGWGGGGGGWGWGLMPL